MSSFWEMPRPSMCFAGEGFSGFGELELVGLRGGGWVGVLFGEGLGMLMVRGVGGSERLREGVDGLAGSAEEDVPKIRSCTLRAAFAMAVGY